MFDLSCREGGKLIPGLIQIDDGFTSIDDCDELFTGDDLGTLPGKLIRYPVVDVITPEKAIYISYPFSCRSCAMGGREILRIWECSESQRFFGILEPVLIGAVSFLISLVSRHHLSGY